MVVGASHRPLVGPAAASVRNADELKFQLVAVLLLAGGSPKHENDVPIPAFDVLRAIELRRNLDVTVEGCPGHRHITCDPACRLSSSNASRVQSTRVPSSMACCRE